MQIGTGKFRLISKPKNHLALLCVGCGILLFFIFKIGAGDNSPTKTSTGSPSTGGHTSPEPSRSSNRKDYTADATSQTLEDRWLRRCKLPSLLDDAEWQRLKNAPAMVMAEAWSVKKSAQNGPRHLRLLAGWFMLDPASAEAWARANPSIVGGGDSERALAWGYMCRPGGYEEFKLLITDKGFDGPGRTWRENGTGLILAAIQSPCAESMSEILAYLRDDQSLADQYAYSMPTDEATMATLDYMDDKGYELGSFVTAGYSGFSSLFERSPELALDWLYQRKPDKLDEVIRFYFRHWDGDDASRSNLRHWLQRTLGDSAFSNKYAALLER